MSIRDYRRQTAGTEQAAAFLFIFAAAIVIGVSSFCLAQNPGGKSATSKPAAKSSSAAPASRPSDKTIKVTSGVVTSYHKTAEDWANKAKKFAPALHLVETQHFLIYSAWEKNQDKGMSDAIENVYKAMCKYFDVDVKDQYWAGKLPIFVMATKAQFVKFTNEIDMVKRPDSGGYCKGNALCLTYIVTNEVKTLVRFYEVVTHEMTHAFLDRYKTVSLIPQWVHEGLAEYMAATLVQNCDASKKYIDAAKTAMKEKKDIKYIFEEVKPNGFDYGIAQSLVRCLLLKDNKAFIKFIDLIKADKTDDDALKEAYKLTKEQLVAEWTKAVAAGDIK